jgi:hypothetical protein
MLDVPATYSLTAIPWPLGDNRGQLEYVLFVATDGTQTRKWSATNTGSYIEDLRRIIPLGNAQDIYVHLLRGEPVLFPGLFDLEHVRHELRGVDSDWQQHGS